MTDDARAERVERLATLIVQARQLYDTTGRDGYRSDAIARYLLDHGVTLPAPPAPDPEGATPIAKMDCEPEPCNGFVAREAGPFCKRCGFVRRAHGRGEPTQAADDRLPSGTIFNAQYLPRE